MTTHEHHAALAPAPRVRVGLELIATFKFIKAATLIAAGLATFGLLNDRLDQAAQDWLQHLALGHGHRLMSELAAKALPYLAETSGKRIAEVGIGAFLYAGVFLVEGFGLWRCKRWAEYLTVGVTASFLPFEIIAVAHRFTLIRATTLGMNVVVIIYLVWQLWYSRPRDTIS